MRIHIDIGVRTLSAEAALLLGSLRVPIHLRQLSSPNVMA